MSGFFALPGLSVKDRPKLWANPLDYIMAQRDKVRLFCFGDSLTAETPGYPESMQVTLRDRFGLSGVTIDKVGYGGHTFKQAIPYLGPHLDLRPDVQVLTMLLGTNDSRLQVGVGSPAYDTKYYCYEGIRGHFFERRPDGIARLFQIPWVNSAGFAPGLWAPAEDWQTKAEKVNQIIRAASRRFSGVEAYALYPVTEDQADYYYDGLHFNALGNKHLAAHFLHALRQAPTFNSDRHYLVGKPYTIADGVESGAYVDSAAGKLTANRFSLELADQVGFNEADNGGVSVAPKVTFHFGEEVILNDIVIITGREMTKYRANAITIEVFNGAVWAEETTLNFATEGMEQVEAEADGLFPYCVYAPATPFKAKGLRLTYSKTFGPTADWLFIGEISACVLRDYTGTVK